uniref:Uncharacterized protein MANES_06G163500 n=1 Tax=Rhizophora mucronata TaxID=61149 RepID=A0A2P2PN17_RHIMU
MDAGECQNETKKTTLQNKIQVEDTVDGDNRKESYNLRASMMNQNEDAVVQATKSNLDADNLVCLIGINCSGDGDAKVDLLNKTQLASEEAGNVPTNVEISALSAVKVRERVKSQEIDLGFPWVDFSENHDNATKSHLEVCSEKPSKVLPDSNSTTLKNPEEGRP